jgi:hypothetical protein
LKQDLHGKGLFVFSDPGGAKPVLALIKSLQHQLTDFLILSDREYGFFKDFGLKVIKPSTSKNEVEDFDPDFIFTGTSYTSKIELNYLKEGKKKNVQTYAFVDHWTNIRERFNSDGEEILPDRICLIDEKAKQIGLRQGLDESAIIVIGNPFQDYLRTWQPSISKEMFFSSLGINLGNKKIMVFAPDPLSNVNGVEKFGFDETTVMNELAFFIDVILLKYIFIFKPHPNQDMSRLNQQVLEKIIVARNDVDNNSLIYYSDLIIGFFSSYLIEAQIMNKRVLRYLPETAVDDPFKDLAIGTLVNKSSFLESL